MTQDTSAHYGTIIVGGGHGGAQAAMRLHHGGYADGLAVLSDESVAPYDRPTLSKGYLEGQIEPDDFLLQGVDLWESTGVDLLLSTKVIVIEPGPRVVVTEDGRRLGYENLIWSAGGHARQLAVPGAELSGVHTLRRLADAERLRSEAAHAKSVVIIGGGYIGLETAASLRKLGLSVTVIEVAGRLLGRVTSPFVADYLARRHSEAGVEFRLGTAVEKLTGEAGHVSGVELSSGEHLPADLVVVGVGLIPEIEAMAVAGAEVGNGIEVDELCRTSLPGIYAIGDCVSFPIPLYGGRRVRLESVQNVDDQAKAVAAAILGEPNPSYPTPWFWSNQFAERLQTAGLLTDYDEAVMRGSTVEGKFSVVYLKDSRILAIDAMNNTKDFVQGKAIIGTRYEGSRERLGDPAVALKALANDPAR